MRVRIILALSLAVSMLLAWMVLDLSRETSLVSAGFHPAAPTFILPAKSGVRTNVVVRRQFFHWRQLESEDYTVYIANLRAVGCPESTIRDIIISEVDELFEKRRVAEVINSDQEWWRLEPSMDTVESAGRKQAELGRERVEMLDKLLGPGWASPSPSDEKFNRLDGPILGKLSDEAKEALRKIETDSKNRGAEYLKSQNEKGLVPLASELARLRLQTREELAKVLSPEQLEEYLLRYSNHAQQMRKELKGFEASQEEFRKIFRATDSYETELATLADATDPASTRRRAELEKARDAAVRETLGPERLALYQYTQDPLFRQSQAEVEQAGGGAEKVLPVFQINRATEEEMRRLKADTSLDPDAREAALIKVQRQQAEAIQKLFGNAPEAPAER